MIDPARRRPLASLQGLLHIFFHSAHLGEGGFRIRRNSAGITSRSSASKTSLTPLKSSQASSVGSMPCISRTAFVGLHEPRLVGMRAMVPPNTDRHPEADDTRSVFVACRCDAKDTAVNENFNVLDADVPAHQATEAAWQSTVRCCNSCDSRAPTQGLDILFTPMSTSHRLMFAGSNRTQLPTRKLGMVPRLALRRIVNLETFKRSASSSAVIA